MKILIIEDERKLSQNMATYLSADNYLCEQVYNYRDAMEKIALYTYDCILLDLNLPDGDGLKILEEITRLKLDSGVIIISARGSLDDKIAGLMTGADDYLPKPFPLPELGIRIYALMRRRQFSNTNLLKTHNIEIDLLSKTVTVNGKPVLFTRSEYELLLFLIGNKNRLVSRNAIAEHLSGDMADMMDNHNFVYSHIKNIKHKLAQAGCENYIKTIYGTGYQWTE